MHHCRWPVLCRFKKATNRHATSWNNLLNLFTTVLESLDQVDLIPREKISNVQELQFLEQFVHDLTQMFSTHLWDYESMLKQPRCLINKYIATYLFSRTSGQTGLT